MVVMLDAMLATGAGRSVIWTGKPGALGAVVEVGVVVEAEPDPLSWTWTWTPGIGVAMLVCGEGASSRGACAGTKIVIGTLNWVRDHARRAPMPTDGRGTLD